MQSHIIPETISAITNFVAYINRKYKDEIGIYNKLYKSAGEAKDDNSIPIATYSKSKIIEDRGLTTEDITCYALKVEPKSKHLKNTTETFFNEEIQNIKLLEEFIELSETSMLIYDEDNNCFRAINT